MTKLTTKRDSMQPSTEMAVDLSTTGSTRSRPRYGLGRVSFSRSDFRYDPTSDVYHCPAGNTLTTTGTLVNDGTTLLYLARKHDCDGCELKTRCCQRSRFVGSRATSMSTPATSLAGTEGFETSRRERKKIEMRFAHLKRILKLGRLRLRGPRGAQDEFVLAAIAQNLRRLAVLVARPPPASALCIA